MFLPRARAPRAGGRCQSFAFWLPRRRCRRANGSPALIRIDRRPGRWAPFAATPAVRVGACQWQQYWGDHQPGPPAGPPGPGPGPRPPPAPRGPQAGPWRDKQHEVLRSFRSEMLLCIRSTATRSVTRNVPPCCCQSESLFTCSNIDGNNTFLYSCTKSPYIALHCRSNVQNCSTRQF